MNALKRNIFLALLLVMPLFASAAAEQQSIRSNAAFPELPMVTPANAEDLEYLQLDAKPNFTPSEIKADVLLIELLNVHCPHCQMQTFSYNELFRQIESNAETKGKIKLLGVAVGNLEGEVSTFRKNYQVAFPIIADPDFTIWRAVGGSSTPFSIYVRQDQPGQAGLVTGTHHGLNTHYQELYSQLTKMAAEDPAVLRRQAEEVVKKQQGIKPILSAQELEFKVRTEFTRFGLIEDFSLLSLPSGRQVYTAVIGREQKRERLFAEVTSRSSVCDICHDVHFIYLFDHSTRIIGFEPLQLTKYGNLNWDERETETMRKKVVGKYLTMPQPFDPAVDAITSATMTSAVIFDSLNQGAQLMRELHTQGLL